MEQDAGGVDGPIVSVSCANVLTALSQALHNASQLVAMGQHSSDSSPRSQIDRMVQFGAKTARDLMKTLGPIAKIPDGLADKTPAGWGNVTTADALKMVENPELAFPTAKYPRAAVPSGEEEEEDAPEKEGGSGDEDESEEEEEEEEDDGTDAV